MNQAQVDNLLRQVKETNQVISNLKAVQEGEFKNSPAGSKVIDRSVNLLKKGQN